MRDLPALLRAAERRVNAHVWPNAGADSHLASIPADRDTDTDLLLLEAANRIATLEAALRQVRDFEPVTNGDYAVMDAIPALRKIAITALGSSAEHEVPK